MEKKNVVKNILALAIALWLPTLAHAEKKPSADELLKYSDRSRGGLEQGLVWDIEIQSTEDGETTSRKFTVKAKGDDALAIATSPARNKGELFLFNDRTMWFYKPGLRKPVGISSRQKLTGQAANGDIASTHYSRDYDGTIVREDTVAGEKTYVLELKARNQDVTYDRIRYWIGAKSKLGLKAEFLSLEGAVLKTADFSYGNTVVAGGSKVPFVSQMTIVDAKVSGNRSIIHYESPKVMNLSASLFNVNNLVR